MNNKKWVDQLEKAFYTPKPNRKEEFLKNIRPREIHSVEMIWQQSTYIRIPVWLFMMAIIAIAVGGAFFKAEETERVITMIMPFTASAAVMETKRSQKYNMMEVEMATRFSLRSVVFARMIVLGIAALIVLCVSSPVIAVNFEGQVIMTAIHILIPYLVTMIISLELERSALGRNTGYLSLIVATVVAVGVYWINNFKPQMVILYSSVMERCGVIIVIALMAITIIEQWKTINNLEAFA